MTQLYLNGDLDYLIVNAAGDWLLVDGEAAGFGTGEYPTSPSPMACSIGSISPTFISVTHGLQRQARSRGGHVWTFRLQYGGMTQANFAPLWSFAVQQGGRYGVFTFAIPAYDPRGSISGTPQVNGGGQTGTSLATDGWTPGSAILKKGDYLQIENDAKVYVVTEDVAANGGGAATISIFPALRRSPSDNYAINVSDPLFRCAFVNDQVLHDLNQCLLIPAFEIELTEVPE